MFNKKKYINNSPYSPLLDIVEEQKKYNKLYSMSKNSEYKTYSDWADDILNNKWKDENNLQNFIGLKHYIILLKNNSEALGDIPFDIISFVFGGSLAGLIVKEEKSSKFLSFIALIIFIEIILIIIRYRSKRELCYYGDLIDLIDSKIDQIKNEEK